MDREVSRQVIDALMPEFDCLTLEGVVDQGLSPPLRAKLRKKSGNL
jgi:hypothetical protein